jgi:hypothetical protein
MVENIAYIYVMMFITAVFFPTFAAAFGAIFAFARVIYAHGYSQSFFSFFNFFKAPQKFIYGALLTHIVELAYLGAIGYASYKMLTL